MSDEFSPVDEHCFRLWHDIVKEAIRHRDTVLARSLQIASDDISPGLIGDLTRISPRERFPGEVCLTVWLEMIEEGLHVRDHGAAVVLRIISDEIFPGLVEPVPPRQGISCNEQYSPLPKSVTFSLALSTIPGLLNTGTADVGVYPDDVLWYNPRRPVPEPEPEPTRSQASNFDDLEPTRSQTSNFGESVSSVTEHLRAFQIRDDELEISRRLLNGEIDESQALSQVRQLFGDRIPPYLR